MTSDSIITLVSAIGEAAVIVALIRGRVWQNFGVFSSYVIWTMLSDCAAFYFQNHSVTPEAYLVFYRIMATVDAVLQFAVLVELAWSVLRPVRASLPRATIFVLAGLIAVAALLVWPLAAMTIPHNLRGESRTIFHLLETCAILRIVCFLVMAGFSQILSIGWRDRELQIATGLGFYSVVSLIVTLFNSHQLEEQRSHQFNLAVSVSYLGSLVYWVLSFAAKEYQRKDFSPQMQQLLVYMGGAARAGSIALTDMPATRQRKKD